MTCINPGNDGSRGGCGKWWVDVSYLWGDVDCPECLKLRPTPRAVDGGQAGENNGQVDLPTATNA